MPLPYGDSLLGASYRSASQRVRVITEAWVEQNGYCLACDGNRLVPTLRNTQARDFECEQCQHPYELKSGRSAFKTRIVDGAYAAMMRRIQSASIPSFLLLHYTATWQISSLWAIHHCVITSAAVEQRPPLANTARRAGWVGCNILLDRIPPEGRVPLIVAGIALPREETRARFAAIQPLEALSPRGRGWAATTLSLLHKVGKVSFNIQEVYTLESELSRLYPSNRNVRAKIRQQLQVLRDAGLLSFVGRGEYRLNSTFLHPKGREAVEVTQLLRARWPRCSL